MASPKEGYGTTHNGKRQAKDGEEKETDTSEKDSETEEDDTMIFGEVEVKDWSIENNKDGSQSIVWPAVSCASTWCQRCNIEKMRSLPSATLAGKAY